MSRRRYTLIGFALALLFTWCGWSFALGRKEPPQIPLALWFPVIALFGLSGIRMILPALIQFPVIAMLFALSIRRWSVGVVLAALALCYTLAAGSAVIMVMSR